VERYVLRVALPDRPGALGQVASRIGAVGGDIVAIDIVSRREGTAVDEFVIELAGDHLMDLLRSEIHEVDGVELVKVVRQPPSPVDD
jgi:ACT domain-containing protein